MDADRFFYLMIMVIALIGVGLFAIPVRAHDQGTCTTRSCSFFDSASTTEITLSASSP